MDERLFRVLLVDDEPHVTDALRALLSGRSDLDVYYANRCRRVLEILNSTRVDVLISDIRMPEMTGLKLLEYVNACQPDCRTIFLTGYADFEYAYAAMQGHAAGYVLKTEKDEVLLGQIDRALAEIQREERVRKLLLAEPFADQLPDALRSPLFAKDNEDAALAALGPAEKLARTVMVYGAAKAGSLREIAGLLPEYVSGEIEKNTVYSCGDGLVWLLALNQARPISWVSSVLERMQSALQSARGMAVSFVVGPFLAPGVSPADTLARMRAFISGRDREAAPCVYTLSDQSVSEDPVQKIKDYIARNIAKDLTMMQLSDVSGYNADYLNRIFRQNTGETISRYIAARRLEFISALLRDPALSIDRVAKLAGFSSRSYFNRFIKRETGMAPTAYRSAM